MRRRIGVLLGVALLVVAGAVVWVRTTHDGGGPGGTASPTASASTTDKRPNIVLVLMDDFSLELLQSMPEAMRMASEGATYDNAFVMDSLCCPSRAVLLTGQTPHQTGVHTNAPNSKDRPMGGWPAFVKHGNLRKQFAVALQRSGYTTGFIGKYLNGYDMHWGRNGAPVKVPGWTEWDVYNHKAYEEWGFKSTHLDADGDLQVVSHPKPPADASDAVKDKAYATNVSSDLALDFIKRHSEDGQPYFLEVATHAPHTQQKAAYPGDSPDFPPAFADRSAHDSLVGGNCGTVACTQVDLSWLKGFDDPRGDNVPTYLRKDGTTAPAKPWRTNPILMTPRKAVRRLRDRVRMVQSVDRMLTRIRAAVGDDTYVVLTSDNGFHLGQHQMNGGKGTPYDSDTRVPMVVVGPGVKPGHRSQFVSEVDLAPTFEDLAGLTPGKYVAGRSFAPTLSHPRAPGNHYAFFEHTWAKTMPGEVDADTAVHGMIDYIPSYIGVRGKRGLLVRFDLDKGPGVDYAWELYDYKVHPWEDTNVFARDHDKPYARDLMRRLMEFDHCRPAQCRAAAR